LQQQHGCIFHPRRTLCARNGATSVRSNRQGMRGCESEVKSAMYDLFAHAPGLFVLVFFAWDPLIRDNRLRAVATAGSL
jgi:hypothetical protein